MEESANSKYLQDTRKEKIIQLDQLKSGDHISFFRSDLSYSHHGIVHEVHKDSLIMIHYFNTAENFWNSLIKGSLYLAEVIRSEWKVDLHSCTEELYLHHYDEIKCFSNEETIRRAIENIGKRGYSLFSNNCEHWARWCRTGDAYSEQVYNFCHFIKQKTATLFIVDPTALFVKDLTTVATASLGTFVSSLGSGLVLGTVETISTCIDIKKKHNELRAGSLSQMAFKKYVVRRVTSASTTVCNNFRSKSIIRKYIFIKIAGGVAGTIVGTILIPVPIVGSIVGGMIGTISGKIFGGLAGIPLAKFVELYDEYKHNDSNEIQTISQLLVRCLITDVNGINRQQTTESSVLHEFLEQLIKQYSFIANEKCLRATQLVENIFSDSINSECFVLTPVPDNNAPEEFASMLDLLVLRWPNEIPQPWNESNDEHILHTTD